MFPLVTTAKSVACKACGSGNLQAVDIDARADKYMVELKWGRLMKAGTESTFFTDFDAWRIYVVDDHGVAKALAGTVGVKAGSATCCDPNENVVVVKGTWPLGGTRFMVVPYANAVAVAANGVMKRGDFWLPMGVMSKKFVDKTKGAAKLFVGSLVFTVTDAKAFAANPLAKGIVTDSLVESLAAKNIKRMWIYICDTCIKAVPKARRLSDSERRLAEEALSVTYEILIPSDAGVKDFGTKSIDTTKLTKSMTKNAVKAGMTTFKASGVVVKPMVEEKIDEKTSGSATGEAKQMAGLSALVMMLAGCLFFA